MKNTVSNFETFIIIFAVAALGYMLACLNFFFN